MKMIDIFALSNGNDCVIIRDPCHFIVGPRVMCHPISLPISNFGSNMDCWMVNGNGGYGGDINYDNDNCDYTPPTEILIS